MCATTEELDCEAHFVRHVVRLPAGDYSVRLPAKVNLDLLGESYQQQAYRRFLSQEKKLSRQKALKAQYAAFIKEYHDLGHISSVSAPGHRYLWHEASIISGCASYA